MTEHVLVAGASGLVGGAVMKHFAEQGHRVTAVSRRRPAVAFGARHVALDLDDRKACATALGELRDVTRLVYAAVHEKPGLVAGWLEADQIHTNRRMLENLLDPVQRAAPGLRHVSLLQGTKAYGVHVRAMEVPAREDRSEARDVPNFYWEQESLLRERQAGQDWHWTIWRPQIVFGAALGSAMNPIAALGVYAALLREQALPLAYPGGPGSVLEATDADLLARAIDWGGRTEAAADRIFNVTNGDVFVWRNVWPAIADALGMEPGPDVPQALGPTLPDRSREWDAIRQRHGLVAPDLASFVGESLHYLDALMGTGTDQHGPPMIVSTVKLRRAGFTEVMDTEDMFRKWFRVLQEQRLLPPR